MSRPKTRKQPIKRPARAKAEPVLVRPLDGRVTCTISDFCDLSSLSRATANRMIRRKDVQTVSIGRRRLIVLQSYYALIERQLAEQG